jgi:hypothetical protein
MKLTDIVLLSLSAGFLIIGIYEVMYQGLGHAYWALMLAVMLFFAFSYRKRKAAK